MAKRSVQISNRHKKLRIDRKAIRKLFAFLDQDENFAIHEGELSLVFVDDPEIAQIHDDFMQDPTPTDVITFPGDPDMEFAGEIVVSADTALEKAEELGEDFAKELTLYLVHGWLHLAGLDDRNEQDRAEMREGEAYLMNKIGTANLVPVFEYR